MDMNAFNKPIIDEFRANAGVVTGQFTGVPILLLETTGAKTGARRLVPLAYLADGARYVIIASFAGAPANPPWFNNLVKNPLVTVEVGTEKFQARAEVCGEPARTELYARMAAKLPIFNDYAAKTARTIPVVALTRV